MSFDAGLPAMWDTISQLVWVGWWVWSLMVTVMYCTDRLVHACGGRRRSLLVSSDLRRSCVGGLRRSLIRMRRWHPRSGAGRPAGLSAAWLVQLSAVAVRVVTQRPALKREQSVQERCYTRVFGRNRKYFSGKSSKAAMLNTQVHVQV